MTFYKDGKLVSQTQIVLSEKEDIQAYVMQLLKNYFKTTRQAHLEYDSSLKDHGLDSLDAVELVMQMEEDLNYKVSAENLS